MCDCMSVHVSSDVHRRGRLLSLVCVQVGILGVLRSMCHTDRGGSKCQGPRQGSSLAFLKSNEKVTVT